MKQHIRLRLHRVRRHFCDTSVTDVVLTIDSAPGLVRAQSMPGVALVTEAPDRLGAVVSGLRCLEQWG